MKMTKTLTGKIIKAVGGLFFVRTADGVVACTARKKLRYGEKELTVGDETEITVLEDGKGTIESVAERKNCLARPEVANVDIAVITVASVPQADFLLADKVLLNCFKQGIRPVIAVNKSDINHDNLLQNVKEDYGKIVEEILSVSALTGENIKLLRNVLKGKISVFCGQSAVGKTSLLNAAAGLELAVGDISEKSGRGKHTTRHAEIFEFAENSYIADTPGFSLLTVQDIRSNELCDYFPDMTELKNGCKFSNCTHISEPGCAVAAAAENGSFSVRRLSRYRDLFAEIKKQEQEQY